MVQDREVIKHYNKLVNDYKEYYFNVYSFLISKGWVIFEEEDAWYNTKGELWTEWLLSPRLNEHYKYNYELMHSEWTEPGAEYEFDIFDIIIENCRSIIPPNNFVSNIDINSNIEQVIKDFYKYQTNFDREENALLINNGWSAIELEDVEAYYDIYDKESNDNPTIVLYLSPNFKKGFINKDNAYKCLKTFPNLVVNSNIWWNYGRDL